MRGRLSLDPYARSESRRRIPDTSLYTDTPEFEVFRRVGEFGNTKFRVRRYGSVGPCLSGTEGQDTATRSTRHGCRYQWRTWLFSRVIEDNVRVRASGFTPKSRSRRLAPVCRITYDRIAYLGLAEGGAVRVTFDRTGARRSWPLRGRLFRSCRTRSCFRAGDLRVQVPPGYAANVQGGDRSH